MVFCDKKFWQQPCLRPGFLHQALAGNSKKSILEDPGNMNACSQLAKQWEGCRSLPKLVDHRTLLCRLQGDHESKLLSTSRAKQQSSVVWDQFQIFRLMAPFHELLRLTWENRAPQRPEPHMFTAKTNSKQKSNEKGMSKAISSWPAVQAALGWLRDAPGEWFPEAISNQAQTPSSWTEMLRRHLESCYSSGFQVDVHDKGIVESLTFSWRMKPRWSENLPFHHLGSWPNWKLH